MTRELQPCGTRAAYQRHLYHGEKACESCLAAAADYARDLSGSSPRTIAKCGTTSGYKHHLRRGEIACAACRGANAAYHRAWRAAR